MKLQRNDVILIMLLICTLIVCFFCYKWGYMAGFHAGEAKIDTECIKFLIE